MQTRERAHFARSVFPFIKKRWKQKQVKSLSHIHDSVRDYKATRKRTVKFPLNLDVASLSPRMHLESAVIMLVGVRNEHIHFQRRPHPTEKKAAE